MDEPTYESMLNEARESLALLETNLPKRVSASHVSNTAKIPFKVLTCRAALLWRMAELCRSAIESLEQRRLAAAILLARAAVETCAAVWYLFSKVEVVVRTGSVGDIDSYLMRMVVGSRVFAGDTQLMSRLTEALGEAIAPDLNPINVLNFVDSVDKTYKGFRQQYDELSEYAHPNWAGTAFLYSKNNEAKRQTDFGQCMGDFNDVMLIGVANLSTSLLILQDVCTRLDHLLPDFIALCERKLQEPKDPSD